MDFCFILAHFSEVFGWLLGSLVELSIQWLSKSDPRAIFSVPKKKNNFENKNFGPFWPPRRRPSEGPAWTAELPEPTPKSIPRSINIFIPLGMLLGQIFGRFWQKINKKSITNHSKRHKNLNTCLHWFLDRFWVDVSSILDSKINKKSIPKPIRKSITSWIDFG